MLLKVAEVSYVPTRDQVAKFRARIPSKVGRAPRHQQLQARRHSPRDRTEERHAARVSRLGSSGVKCQRTAVAAVE
jgi:hypothetical protein